MVYVILFMHPSLHFAVSQQSISICNCYVNAHVVIKTLYVQINVLCIIDPGCHSSKAMCF